MLNTCQANAYYVLGIANPLYMCYLIWYPQQLSDVGAIIIPFSEEFLKKQEENRRIFSIWT